MKKKIALGFMLVCVATTLFACGKTPLNYVRDNLSEKTEVYFLGENDKFYCSLSSGEREEDYFMDGKSGETVGFALLSFSLTEINHSNILKVNLSIDNVRSEVELEANSMSGTFLADLEKRLTGNEIIEITYGGKTQRLDNLSKNFTIDCDRALEIAAKELEDKILQKKTYANLNAECYLRIMDKKANNFDGIFWCFTVVNTDNKNFSVIISTEDGSILAKSN